MGREKGRQVDPLREFTELHTDVCGPHAAEATCPQMTKRGTRLGPEQRGEGGREAPRSAGIMQDGHVTDQQPVSCEPQRLGTRVLVFHGDCRRVPSERRPDTGLCGLFRLNLDAHSCLRRILWVGVREASGNQAIRTNRNCHVKGRHFCTEGRNVNETWAPWEAKQNVSRPFLPV